MTQTHENICIYPCVLQYIKETDGLFRRFQAISQRLFDAAILRIKEELHRFFLLVYQFMGISE